MSRDKVRFALWAGVIGIMTTIGSIAAVGWQARGYLAAMDDRHAALAKQIGEHVVWDQTETAALESRLARDEDQIRACCPVKHGG